METNQNMVMIVSMVDKSVADEVASQVYEIAQSKVSIFYGSGKTDERGFLGVRLNDEVVEIVCVVDHSMVDDITKLISEVGRMDELGKGYIVEIPSVTFIGPTPKADQAEAEPKADQ
ncbi:MAG: hypothetical protein IKP04_08885 [Candidatus Methanomethylophilaceae archaeon]|nr:hypothetical protein [Candidatus Methanomethylophilaceae archaeon]